MLEIKQWLALEVEQEVDSEVDSEEALEEVPEEVPEEEEFQEVGLLNLDQVLEDHPQREILQMQTIDHHHYHQQD